MPATSLPPEDASVNPEASSFVRIEGVTPREKAGWVKAAQRSEHKKLVPWIVATLNEAARKSGPDAEKDQTQLPTS